MAEFRCRHDTADFVGWRFNGSFISQANPLPDISTEVIDRGGKLTIVGRQEYNGTEVVGVAIFYSSSPPLWGQPSCTYHYIYIYNIIFNMNN